MILHPSYSRTDPCEALGCNMRAFSVMACREQYCPHRWQREAAEDRARREERDRKEAEAHGER